MLRRVVYAALRQVAGYKREALAPPTVVRRMVLYESSARPFVVFAPLPTADVSLAVPLLLLKQLNAAPAGCQPVRLLVCVLLRVQTRARAPAAHPWRGAAWRASVPDRSGRTRKPHMRARACR